MIFKKTYDVFKVCVPWCFDNLKYIVYQVLCLMWVLIKCQVINVTWSWYSLLSKGKYERWHTCLFQSLKSLKSTNFLFLYHNLIMIISKWIFNRKFLLYKTAVRHKSIYLPDLKSKLTIIRCIANVLLSHISYLMNKRVHKKSKLLLSVNKYCPR